MTLVVADGEDESPSESGLTESRNILSLLYFLFHFDSNWHIAIRPF